MIWRRFGTFKAVNNKPFNRQGGYGHGKDPSIAREARHTEDGTRGMGRGRGRRESTDL